MLDRRLAASASVTRLPSDACRHPATRRFPDPVVREMLRALGVVTCDRCHAALRIHGRRFVREIPGRP